MGMCILLNKPNFKLCKKLAIELLARQNIWSSTIDVQSLKYDKKIIFDSIQGYAEATNTPIKNFIDHKTQLLSDGCCIPMYDRGIFVVLYNFDLNTSLERLNWTLAHEVGHIYLGHKKDSDIEEIEAHYFAAQLLIPEYILFMIDQKWGLDEKDICKLFNVSQEAARKRVAAYKNKMYINKGAFDEDIWKMMCKHIEDYYFIRNASDGLKRFMNTSIVNI